jgi:hypothetical protein
MTANSSWNNNNNNNNNNNSNAQEREQQRECRAGSTVRAEKIRSAYKLALKRTLPLPVVTSCILGGLDG